MMIMDIIQVLIQWSIPIFIVAVIGFIAYHFLKILTKSVTKPISREEIERKNFIKRMRINTNQSNAKWLYRGKDIIGRITHSRAFVNVGNPSSNLIMEAVVKPVLFWKITNPLAKEQAFQINMGEWKDNHMMTNTLMADKDKLIVPFNVSFNYYFGIYYDITLAREHQDIILGKDLALTDLHNEKSVDFAKAQEMATIGYIPYAHDMGMKEKDIQHEIARKKGEQQSI
jgi:hypothetical protein